MRLLLLVLSLRAFAGVETLKTDTNETSPTAVVNAHAGNGATCTVSNATTTRGKINLTTGILGLSSGIQCTVTFPKAFATPPLCVFSPYTATASANLVSKQIYFNTTASNMTVNFGIASLTSTAYSWAYFCGAMK